MPDCLRLQFVLVIFLKGGGGGGHDTKDLPGLLALRCCHCLVKLTADLGPVLVPALEVRGERQLLPDPVLIIQVVSCAAACRGHTGRTSSCNNSLSIPPMPMLMLVVIMMPCTVVSLPDDDEEDITRRRNDGAAAADDVDGLMMKASGSLLLLLLPLQHPQCAAADDRSCITTNAKDAR